MKAKQLLGKRIRELRKQRGLSMESLAVEADINDKYLGSIERGQQAASIDIIEKIAGGLSVEVYELFVYRGLPERVLRARAKELLGEATDDELQRVVAVLEAMLH